MNGHILLSLFHILFVVPLFLYVAIQRAACPDWLYLAVFILGIILLTYHGIKAAWRLSKGSSSAWINVFHAALIAPLLIYIGYYGKKTPRPAYELLAMAGFAAFGYHIYSIILQLQIYDEDN